MNCDVCQRQKWEKGEWDESKALCRRGMSERADAECDRLGFERLKVENARLRNWLRVVAFHRRQTCPWHQGDCAPSLQWWAEDALHGKLLSDEMVAGLPDPKTKV
jgi:uncharacterized protein YfaT (DUF1175 family)